MQLKDLWRRSIGEKAAVRDGKILEESEGILGPSRLWVNGRAWDVTLSDRVGISAPRRTWGFDVAGGQSAEPEK